MLVATGWRGVAYAVAAAFVVGVGGCGGSSPASPGIGIGTGDTGGGIGNAGGADTGAAGSGGMASPDAGATGTGGSGEGTGGAGPVVGPTGVRPDPSVPVFDEGRLHDVALQMAPEDWQSIIDDSRADEWRHAKLTYDGVVLEDVGVRPSGEGSRFKGNQKQSVRVKFDAFPGRGHFAGLKEITVKGEYDDASMMRERMALFVYRAMMPATRAVHSRFVVNGGLRGVYTVREVWDSAALKVHFTEPLGPLYRLRPQDMAADPYKFVGTDLAAYVPMPWEPKLKNPARGDDVIPAFLNVLATAPLMVEQVTDVDNLLSYMACSAVLGSIDGFTGNAGVEDHYQYFDPKTGKFFILPWDPDNTLGSVNEPPDRTIYRRWSSNVLALIMRDMGDFRARYKAKVTATMAAVPTDKLNAEIDRLYAQIKDTAHEDPVKTIDNGWFDWSVGYLKDFAARRYANVADQVANGP